MSLWIWRNIARAKRWNHQLLNSNGRTSLFMIEQRGKMARLGMSFNTSESDLSKLCLFARRKDLCRCRFHCPLHGENIWFGRLFACFPQSGDTHLDAGGNKKSSGRLINQLMSLKLFYMYFTFLPFTKPWTWKERWSRFPLLKCIFNEQFHPSCDAFFIHSSLAKEKVWISFHPSRKCVIVCQLTSQM